MRSSASTLALLLLAAALVASCGGPTESEGPPQSIILVVVDTLRADHLTPYGYDVRPTSPALQRRAATAVRYDRAYSSSSWTLPAFGTILTGEWPSRHAAGIHGVGEDGRNWTPLDPSIETLPELLGAAGYATGAIVNNWYLNERFGVDRGFQHYDWRNGTDPTWRPASESVDLALEWLEDNGRQRQFLMLHLMEPHFSYKAPEGFEGRFRSAEEMEAFEVPSADGSLIHDGKDAYTAEQWELVRAAYDEEIAYVDVQIDRFFRELEEAGLWRDALVIFTADHGEELYDHGDYGHGHAMYDEVTRIPFLVWWKDASAGARSMPVSLADIVPTVLEFAGVEPPRDLAGTSLIPSLGGEDPPDDRLLLLERHQFQRDADVQAAVLWPHKLVDRAATMELYDLVEDPAEENDLSAQLPELAGDLRAELVDRVDLARRQARVARTPELTEADREALRALGYIQ